MKIDFKKPRYMIPLIIMPFLFVFFYVYKSSYGKEKPKAAGKDSLQVSLADVSGQVRTKGLADKLDAYRQEYKKSDGYTAVGSIADEELKVGMASSAYNEREKRMLDSIDQMMKAKYGKGTGYPSGSSREISSLNAGRYDSKGTSQDRALAEALSKINRPFNAPVSAPPARQADPMQLFRAQMALVDSIGKTNDPEMRQRREEENRAIEAERELKGQKKVSVVRAGFSTGFNTIRADEDNRFLSAIIDQDITGFSGSRLRIRLLDDLLAGKFLIKKGTYLYALISGFSGQRVLLSITSIMSGGELIPVKLDLYDHDGLRGLYVPASAFREFTRDLGVNSSQGVTLQQMAENNNQLVMGILQKMFQSTTAAVGKLIRSNKAKIKYNTQVMLIDPDQLKEKQNSY